MGADVFKSTNELQHTAALASVTMVLSTKVFVAGARRLWALRFKDCRIVVGLKGCGVSGFKSCWVLGFKACKFQDFGGFEIFTLKGSPWPLNMGPCKEEITSFCKIPKP